MRKYKLNTNYFNKIDSHEKAYVLGFLYADGSNRGDGITFTQNVERIDILENIKKALESEAPIKELIPGHYSFQVFSDIMVKDIEKLGVVKNKSLVLQFPTEKQFLTNLCHHSFLDILMEMGVFGMEKEKR